MTGGGGTYALIRQAIEQKLCVDAVFGGHRRRLCPHVIGARSGEPRALFFQYAGGSRKGLERGGGWRCLAIAGLSEVSVYEGEWRSAPHSQPQRCIDEVDLEVV